MRPEDLIQSNLERASMVEESKGEKGGIWNKNLSPPLSEVGFTELIVNTKWLRIVWVYKKKEHKNRIRCSFMQKSQKFNDKN